MISKLKTKLSKVVNIICQPVVVALIIAIVWIIVIVLAIDKSVTREREMKINAHREWTENMGYDFSYKTWKELKGEGNLPTIPKE